ncbi:hypothetical protein BDZ89DRAFT_1160243 [Hymenopellis radicata]|nr:hypothetical protein BDZ89DRAFT_1160243 [Hymenopellis radicata]
MPTRRRLQDMLEPPHLRVMKLPNARLSPNRRPSLEGAINRNQGNNSSRRVRGHPPDIGTPRILVSGDAGEFCYEALKIFAPNTFELWSVERAQATRDIQTKETQAMAEARFSQEARYGQGNDNKAAKRARSKRAGATAAAAKKKWALNSVEMINDGADKMDTSRPGV